MDPQYEDHGTAVLGEVIGAHNDYGVNGFAADVQYGVVAVTVDEWPDVPHYFQEAVDHLDAGDVWLIELQMYPPGQSATPMEWLQVNYDVIWTSAWALGIVCVEAGANGSQDLDDPVWDGVFNRNIRDSGAIMVGAGTPTGRVAEWFTNYGTRMDAHGWGSSIVTTGYGDLYSNGSDQTQYTSGFSGTSGASPMVTGSALCIQGHHRALYGMPMDPIVLRTLINETGIPHLDPVKEIGPRPDLGAAADAIGDLTAAPGEVIPAGLRVEQSPNPFREGTEFRFAASAEGPARLSIFDLRGRRVRDLLDETGTGRLVWDGRSARGHVMSSGVYLYRLEAGGKIASGRMVKIH